jgi:uncharacterized membrane protein YkvA (DUF1232 family)
MNVSPTGVAITQRFFEAIAMLKSQRRIRGLQTFTRAHDINRWNMNTVKAKPETSVLKTEWIAYLVDDYDISPDWILFGRGSDVSLILFQKANY